MILICSSSVFAFPELFFEIQRVSHIRDIFKSWRIWTVVIGNMVTKRNALLYSSRLNFKRFHPESICSNWESRDSVTGGIILNFNWRDTLYSPSCKGQRIMSSSSAASIPDSRRKIFNCFLSLLPRRTKFQYCNESNYSENESSRCREKTICLAAFTWTTSNPPVTSRNWLWTTELNYPTSRCALFIWCTIYYFFFILQMSNFFSEEHFFFSLIFVSVLYWRLRDFRVGVCRKIESAQRSGPPLERGLYKRPITTALDSVLTARRITKRFLSGYRP